MNRVIMMTIFVFLLFDQVVSQVVNTQTLQNSGTFLGFGEVFKEDLEYQQVATSNDGTQRTGTSLFFKGGDNGKLAKSSLTVDNDAQSNIATSDTDSTSSGAVSIFNYIKNSDVDLDSNSQYNKAYIDYYDTADGSGSGSAVSGVDQQALQVKNSVFTATSNANYNLADNNYSGKSIAGIMNSFGTVKNSQNVLENTASNNQASNDDGIAVAGIQNNVFESKTSANEFVNTATNNNATSYNGQAVAGVQTNFNTIKNDGTGNRGGDALTSTDTATDNTAKAYNGKAIAGTQTNIDLVKNGDVNLVADAQDNTALGYDNTYSTPGQYYDTVSGVQLNVNRIVNSGTGNGQGGGSGNNNQGNGNNGGFQLDATSQNNNAINMQTTGGDAISGIQVNVGRTTNSDVTFNLESRNNYAKSESGDAVAASVLNINRAKNTNVDQNLVSTGNIALAPNGNAIIDSETNIRYIGK